MYGFTESALPLWRISHSMLWLFRKEVKKMSDGGVYSGGFALVVVLFILLIIIGASYVGGYGGGYGGYGGCFW